VQKKGKTKILFVKYFQYQSLKTVYLIHEINAAFYTAAFFIDVKIRYVLLSHTIARPS